MFWDIATGTVKSSDEVELGNTLLTFAHAEDLEVTLEEEDNADEPDDAPQMVFDIDAQLNLLAARDDRPAFDTNRSVDTMCTESDMSTHDTKVDDTDDAVSMASSSSGEVPSMVDTDSSQQEPSTISQDSASQVAKRMNADSVFRNQVLATANPTTQSPPTEEGAGP